MEAEYEKIAEMVYDSLLGHLNEGYAIPQVRCIFVPGHPCYEAYTQMRDTYQRICGRLGVGEEDKDCEIMIDLLLAHGKLLAMEMFSYGVQFGKASQPQ